jgi:hypothetical protein
MASTAGSLNDLPRTSERNEHLRRHSASGTTLYCHDSGFPSASQGHLAPPGLATTSSSLASTSYSGVSVKSSTSLSVEEPRRSRLASKSIQGLNSFWTSFRSKSSDPPSAHRRRQRPHSTSSVDVSSLDVRYCPRSYLQAPYQSLHDNPTTQADLSSLVPDYLDLPPPYSSPLRERQEVIDWKAHFERTPLLITTASSHSAPTIQDVVSARTPLEGAWDRVAQRLNLVT